MMRGLTLGYSYPTGISSTGYNLLSVLFPSPHSTAVNSRDAYKLYFANVVTLQRIFLSIEKLAEFT